MEHAQIEQIKFLASFQLRIQRNKKTAVLELAFMHPCVWQPHICSIYQKNTFILSPTASFKLLPCCNFQNSVNINR
jgi:hypothetical protein